MTQADPNQTRAVYEAQAAAYDAQRSRSLFEARWLARFAACLPEGGRVLDLGCGAGEPIARWFMAEGFTLTGVDFAGAMLDIARQRWPEGDWRQADMRSLDLGERFDGIIAWDSFFHLTEAEQRETLRRMAAHLAPGGSLLFTAGPEAGEAAALTQPPFPHRPPSSALKGFQVIRSGGTARGCCGGHMPLFQVQKVH